VFSRNRFARAGGIHIGPEQSWLEGDPGIANVTISNNVFEELGNPPCAVLPGVPPNRGIVVANNSEKWVMQANKL